MRPQNERSFIVLALCVVTLWCYSEFALAQSSAVGEEKSERYSVDASKHMASPFAGKWSYRSFRSNPDLSIPVNELLFGAGNLELSQPSSDRVAGTLGGEGWSLTLHGGATCKASIRSPA